MIVPNTKLNWNCHKLCVLSLFKILSPRKIYVFFSLINKSLKLVSGRFCGALASQMPEPGYCSYFQTDHQKTNKLLKN